MIRTMPKSGLTIAIAFLAFVLAFWGIQYATRGYWEPDEARFVYVAREMSACNSPFLPMRNGLPYAHKPPLMMWLITAGEKTLGPPFGSRLPVLLGTFLSLLSFFTIARKITNRKSAFLAVLLLSTSADFWFAMGRGQIDPLLTGLVLSSVALFPFDRSGRIQLIDIAPSAILAGLGILAKGPVGLVLPILIILALLLPSRPDDHPVIPPVSIAAGLAIALAIPALWLCAAAACNAPTQYFHEIIFKQTFSRIAGGYGHIKPFYYYLPVFLLGFMPWAVLLPFSILGLWKSNRLLLMRCGLWLIFVIALFSLSVSKRSVYILTAYPPAALIVASAAEQLQNSKLLRNFTKTLAILLPVILLATGIFCNLDEGTHGILPPLAPYRQIAKGISPFLIIPGVLTAIISIICLVRNVRFDSLLLPLALVSTTLFFSGNFILPAFNPIKEPLAIKSLSDKYVNPNDPLVLYQIEGETLSLHASRNGTRTDYSYELLLKMASLKRGLVVLPWEKASRIKSLFSQFITDNGEFQMGKKRFAWFAFDIGRIAPDSIENKRIRQIVMSGNCGRIGNGPRNSL